ncbi:hypothetical protein GCM10020255_082090 [Rhodococcus baikonurensis]
MSEAGAQAPVGDRSRVNAVLTGSAWLRSLYAAAGGFLIFAGFPPRPLWFLAPVGIALLTCVLTNFGRGGLRLSAGFGYGYLAGLGFLVPLLPWIGVFVGAVPWIALAAVESLFVGLFGLLAVLVGRLPWAPLWIAATWTLTEWLRSSVPFGGFPWGRLAFGQSEGWLLPLASVGGAPLLSFAVALTGTGLAAVAVAVAAKRWDRGFFGAVAAVLVPVIVALVMSPVLSTMDSGDRTITVAAIQGSVPRLGLDFNSQRKQVLDNHVTETVKLAAEVDAGRVDQPDVVIWPENASDIDPLRNADAAADITRASEAIGAPILVGTVLVNADRTTTNSVIVWTAPTVLRNSTTRRSFSRSANTCPTEASSGTSPRTPIARVISYPARATVSSTQRVCRSASRPATRWRSTERSRNRCATVRNCWRYRPTTPPSGTPR